MRTNHREMKNKKIRYLFFVICILLSSFIMTVETTETKKEITPTIKQINLTTIIENYNNYVKTKEEAQLYEKKEEKYMINSTIHGSIELKLDPNYEIKDKYYKLLNSELYIPYQMVEKIDNLTPLSKEYKHYKNYIPFNENIILKDKAKLYVNDTSYYEVSEGNFPIIIKDENRYGVEYNDSLVYVNKEDVENIIESNNTMEEITSGISVLNYHYTVSSVNEGGELDECTQTICITDKTFDNHISYLRENNYYGATIRDLELFIDGKINLPKKSVVITIDDGWYVRRSIEILEKYQMYATLFLIGSLASPNDYMNEYLEIHSHSWDMHKLGQCPANIGRGGILCLDEETILNDLRKSRESLNNTTYFCYPFYDYNERAIRLLKEAGFTMAFAGEKWDSTVRVGQDKFRIPRYVILNSTTMDEFIRYVS